MADIFISYKREDQQHARNLSIALEARGFEVWYDFELISGDQYRGVIRRVIDQCPAAIVVWSRRSVVSEFVLDEAAYAKSRGKLCPVRIEDVELPFGFGQSHTDDLSEWSGDPEHPGLQRLIRAVEVKVGRAAGSPRPATKSDHATVEFDAFKNAQLKQDESALRRFLVSYPDGAFSAVVKEQLRERSSVFSRFKRVSLPVRAAAMLVPMVGALWMLYGVVSISVDRGLDKIGSSVPEPLTDEQLTLLMRKSLELVAKGECSAELMVPRVLGACREQVGNMKTFIEPLGNITKIKNEGRQRSVATGMRVTRFLVTFDKGQMLWELNGNKDGRLSGFWTSGRTDE